MKAKYYVSILLCGVLLLGGCSSGKPGRTDQNGASSGAVSAAESEVKEENAASKAVLTEEELYTPESFATEPEEPSENYTEQPLVETGEYWEGSLGPGVYRVGTDIPVGVLDITAEAGSGHVTSSDGTLNLDMTAPGYEDEDDGYDDFGTDADADDGTGDDGVLTPGQELVQQIQAAENTDFPDLDSVDTLTDEEMNELLAQAQVQEETDRFRSVGFMDDVMITVSGAVKLKFESENCDVAGMNKRKKAGEPVSLTEGSFTAGEDFEPGTYNITAVDGFGSVRADDGSMFAYMGSPEEPGINSGRYMNCVLQEGVTLHVEDLTVELQRVSD